MVTVFRPRGRPPRSPWSTRARRLGLCFGAAGSAVVICSVVVAAQPSAPQWRVIQEARVDGNAEDFSVPNGFLLALRGGEFAFADRARHQVRYYSATGRNIANLGGLGGGPGEFVAFGRLSSILGGLVGDSLWYYDEGGRRLTVVDERRRIVRSYVLPPLPLSRTSDGQRAVVPSFAPLALYADGTLLGRRSRPATSPGQRERVDIVLRSESGSEVVTLAELPGRKSVAVRNPTNGTEQHFPVPLWPMPQVAVAQDGNRFVVVAQDVATQPGTLHLLVLSRSGDTLVTRTFPIEGVPVTPEVLDRSLGMLERDLRAPNARFSPQFASEILRVLRSNAPRISQPIGYVRVGNDNSIWLSLPVQGDSQPWLVLNPRGEPVGRVVLGPPSRFILGAATLERILAIVTNTDGIPSIVQYRVMPR